jgi:phosphatidylserine/phosphatidylglycerophosphate/cardiolipin synthase-like enzyme
MNRLGWRRGRQHLAVLVIAAAVAVGTVKVAHADGGTQANVSVCFVPSEVSCTDEIVAALDNARSTIRVISYELTSHPIIVALANAHGRGVDVQIVADKRNLSGPTALANLGIDVRYDDRVTLQHNKIIVIDRKLVIGGSFNHTFSARNHNGENVTFIWSDAVAEQFLAYFAAREKVSRPAIGQ